MSTRYPLPASRRRFLKQCAAGATAAALAPSAFAAAPRRADTLGIALVGLGYYATDVLAPALTQTQHVRLAGIVTGTPSKAAAWQAKYGIPEANVYSYDTFDRMADNPDIDIVYIVLPNSMHAEYTIRAARAGKHVLCEKPMATSVAECAAMIEACARANRALSIGYRLHFEPHTQEIMRLGREQDFGPVRFVTAAAGYPETRADHWKVKQAYGGGAMMDMGVYALQAARYATGEEPTLVTAQTYTTRPEIFDGVDETTTFQLLFPSGAVANLQTSFGIGMNYLRVTAAKGWYGLDPFSAYGGIKGRSSKGEIRFPEINQQAAQMDEVGLCIRENRPMRVPGEEGLRDLRVVEAVYASIAGGGRSVKLG